MTTPARCQVLRCDNLMTDDFTASAGIVDRTFAVCAEHDEHIRSRGDWRLMRVSPDPLDFSDELVCAPEDLDADGTLLVESTATLSRITSAYFSSRPEATELLSWETRRWGHPDEVDKLELQMTRDQLRGLRDLLIRAYGSD